MPEHCIAQDDAAQQALVACAAGEQERRVVPALYRRSGVQTRHSVLLASSTNHHPAQQTFYPPAADRLDGGPTTAERMQRYARHAADLACEAASAALADADTPAADITHLVTVSCSGFASPGFDLAMIQRLGMQPGVARTHLGFMGCHGALNGLRVARAYAESDPNARVLMCALELCSLHHQYSWEPEKIVSNALFADGSAAVVARADFGGAGAGLPRIVDSASAVVPDSTDAMTWNIGDNGFQMTLSPSVPELIRARLKPWMDAWLARHQLDVERVASWGVHPGGPRILQACEQALELDPQCLAASRGVLARYGNMSSPTVVFLLDQFRRQGGCWPGVLLAFGPGLVIEAALVVS